MQYGWDEVSVDTHVITRNLGYLTIPRWGFLTFFPF